MSMYTPIPEGALATPSLFNAIFEELSGGVFSFESHGILGSNTASANGDAIEALETWLNDETGPYYNKQVTLIADPKAVYLCNRDLTVRRSFVKIDLQGATWNSSSRFVFDGDSGIDGDTSTMLQHVYVCNGFIGMGGEDSTILARGPRFLWCRDSGAYDLVKNCRSNTAYNASFCINTWFVNCKNFHGPSSGGASIGFLFHMCDDSGAIGCEVAGDGYFAYGYQLKGGSRCELRDCTVHDITNGYANGVAFRLRGDAPYKPSNTANLVPTKTYPFDTLWWDEPDPRRESIDSKIVNCRVWNTPTMNAVGAQEQTRGIVSGLWARNVRNGISVTRLGTATEGNGHGITIDNVDVEANSRGIYFNGAITTAEVVDEDTGEVTTEVLGDGSLFEGVVLRNFTAKGLGAGLEGVRLERCHKPIVHNGRGISDSGVGISIRQACVEPDLSDIEGESLTSSNGVLITSSVIHPRLHNVTGITTTPTTVKEVNCAALPSVFSGGQPLRGTSTGASYAVLADWTTAQEITPSAAVEGGSNVGDGTVESIATMAVSVEEVITLTATSATEFSVTGSATGAMGTATVGVAFEAAQIHFLIVDGETPFQAGDTFAITVSIVHVGDVFRLEGRVQGKETTGGGGYAEYHIKGLFRRADETTVSQIGSTIDVSTAIETDGTWDGAAFNISGLAVLLRARAKTGVNVEWSGTLGVQLISAL